MGEIIIDSGFGFLKSRELALMFIAAFGTLLALPWCRAIATTHGLVSQRNNHSEPVPIVGGLIICLFAACMVILGINRLLMTGVFLMSVVGMVCDRYHFGYVVKFICELIICAVYLRTGYGAIYPMFFLHLVLMMAVIISINITDDIDGLAIGIFIIAFIPLALIGFKIFITSICGALILLAVTNLSKYKISFGNGCSLALGFMIAGLIFSPGFVVYGSLDQASLYCALDSIMFVVLILPLPIFDMIRVMIIRLCHRQSPFASDRRNLHCLLADRGLSNWLVTIIMIVLNVIGFMVVWWLMDLIEIVL